MRSQLTAREVLELLCDQIHWAQRQAEEERKRELFGDTLVHELLLMRKDKVRVELRKENAGHHEPHIHVTHSDKIDASIKISDLQVIAGTIDPKTLKHLRRALDPVRDRLQEIWDELNEKDNSVAAEKMISNLFL